MALITLRQLLDHAAEYGYGVPAFNINNMEQGLAILRAAKATDAPVILQASRGARSYAGDAMLRHIVEALIPALTSGPSGGPSPARGMQRPRTKLSSPPSHRKCRNARRSIPRRTGRSRGWNVIAASGCVLY